MYMSEYILIYDSLAATFIYFMQLLPRGYLGGISDYSVWFHIKLQKFTFKHCLDHVDITHGTRRPEHHCLSLVYGRYLSLMS